MPDTLTDANTSLDSLEQWHLHGHNCPTHSVEGQLLERWFNPNAGSRQACPVLLAARQLRETLLLLSSQVHTAAHTDESALLTGAAAAGYTLSEARELEPDDQAGLLQMGRHALEALAEHLDPALQ